MRMTRSRENDENSTGKDIDSDVESINCCQLNVHKAKIKQRRSAYANNLGKGLSHKRQCTDVIFLLVFIACLVGWFYLGYFALKTTSPEAILAPTDSRNRRCGFDEGVKDKPNVFYFDLLKCFPPKASVLQCNTPRVCVSECPKENFYLKVFLESTNMNTIRDKMICQDGFNKGNIYSRDSAIKAVQNSYCAEWYLESRPIFRRCLYDRIEMYRFGYSVENFFNGSTENQSEMTNFHILTDVILSYILCFITQKIFIFQVCFSVVFQNCVGTSLAANVGNRCLPKSIRKTTDDVVVVFESLGRQIESTINGVTGKQLFDASKAMADISEFGHAVFEDLQVIWPWILFYVSVAALVSFIYIIIMRWISGLMVWLSIFASIGLLSFCCYYTFAKYQELSEYNKTEQSAELQDSLLGLLWKEQTWLGFFIISVSILIIILITIIFLRSRITLAVELIKEGSKAVVSSWSAVIFPVFPWILQLAILAYSVMIFAYLMNSGVPIKRVFGLNETLGCVCRNDYKDGSLCDETTFDAQCRMSATNSRCITAGCYFSETETQKQAIYLNLYNLLMFLWCLFFASGFGQMVLASTFSCYYWTFNKNDLPVFMMAGGVWRVIRYHLGTISLGSFLLALCNWIRILIEISYNYLNKYDNNFVKLLKCCCSCFFWCLNNFLKFLNKNAYIMCAIHSKNFCSSARLAFNLLLRNIIRVAILDKVTNFLFFLGKIMVTSGLGILAFYFFSNPVPPLGDPFKGEKYVIQYYFVPVVIICVVTYFISSLFFGVYAMAVDTIFLCALEDLETNDGSPEKPYYMSKNLMKILKKKNEIKMK